MSEARSMKLFICYSHRNEQYLKGFVKHLAPLRDKGLIEDWYDRKILPGKDYQSRIDNNLEDADIICLLISADFLASDSCMDEKKQATEFRIKKNVSVVPIILSACGWKDDADISPLLLLPEDGKPVSSFKKLDDAWHGVYNGIKDVVEDENKISQLRITEDFQTFLKDTELLSKAHSQKEEVILEDIFVYPELIKYDTLREYDSKKNAEDFIFDLHNDERALIAGENQSGKTSLCKKLFIELRKKNYIPVYISPKYGQYQGDIESIIAKAQEDQYEQYSTIEKIDKCKIVPILDDFHEAKKKDTHIKGLSKYKFQIVIVDDIYALNIQDDELLATYTHYKISQYRPSLRNKLIKKWISLTEKEIYSENQDNEKYRELDNKTEVVDAALGRIIGKGIMPAFPFFILSVLSTYETFTKPLDQEITSQGYCYQALIYMYLRKQNISNDDIDTYVNYLTEMAYYFYSNKKREITKKDYEQFLESYQAKYNVPIALTVMMKKLLQSNIIHLDKFNNYSMSYQYLNYYFVAKYFAENLDSCKKEIDHVINNLHKDENSYIAIFVTHHTKDNYILNEIKLNAVCLFDKFKEAALTSSELDFFDEQLDLIVEAVLPAGNSTSESERKRQLIAKDRAEEIYDTDEKKTSPDVSNDFEINLRRSIKTVEVMGRIIRNRAGSLRKPQLLEIFEEAMNINLRILTFFFELIQNEDGQREIVESISNRLNKIIESKEEDRIKTGAKPRKPDKEELQKLATTIFWNINFFVVYGIMNKTVHSLGSNKLTAIIEDVCDRIGTPASFLVKHGILMWYNKNIQIDDISNRVESDGFSDTAKRIVRHMIVDHCTVHHIGFREKQKIQDRFGISAKRLLLQEVKAKS